MAASQRQSLLDKLRQGLDGLTPKGRVLANYILQNPRSTVFLRTCELARECGVSEATVVRFVEQIGYRGYRDFIRALRDVLDTELTLPDRVELTDMKGAEGERMGRVIRDEIQNLNRLYRSLDPESIRQAADMLRDANRVYVVGSRLSYTFAYYLGWSLTKIRSRVRILKGSDSTCIDWLTICDEPLLVVMIATSRYPNELLRLAKFVWRCGHTLMVIADSSLCPLGQFAHLELLAPCEHFPIVGSPSTISCLINCLIVELINRDGKALKAHQEKLEQAFVENDILFNLEKN